jgi:hypothetical protein
MRAVEFVKASFQRRLSSTPSPSVRGGFPGSVRRSVNYMFKNCKLLTGRAKEKIDAATGWGDKNRYGMDAGCGERGIHSERLARFDQLLGESGT